ncbi:uncharacterized protein LOC131683307 [Topomyia yanbarensis]|uniref:uncharacterized protein LOC131683307 n=2 Tax=Topomyia yanbarensis TaxID=2498891 RepID=UPI00273B86ED|nr:uncharacterized protein LOC131683307 [Topomyia yanbarensis]
MLQKITADTPIPKFQDKAILNGTHKQIPNETAIILSLGPKFALPYQHVQEIPLFHLIADIETVLQTNPNERIQNNNRCTIVNNMQNHINRLQQSTSNNPLERFCNSATKITRKFLKENPDIAVLQSDKGNKTVLMTTADYQTRMFSLLNDTHTYLKIDRDPTLKFQKQNNSLVQRLKQLKLVDPKTASQLTTYKASCPRIYGQPKAHKPGLPLRPVVPNMTAPSYCLSKFIGQILKSSISTTYNIKDSFTFCEYINTITLPPDYILVSFDVVSLFTCIPKSLITHNIIYNWNNIKQHTNINLDLLLEIVEFCIDSSYFKFDDKYYRQIFGTAMGNPLSPVLADLVLEGLLDTTITKLSFKPPILKKYVDDFIMAIPLNKLKQVHDILNNYDKHIQFTYELEENRRLPYLDMVLVRTENQEIRTEWYSKPIASGRFLNFHSYHSYQQKINVAKNFISRVEKLSTNLNRPEQIQIMDKYLKQNDYPKSLRNRLINNNKTRAIPTTQLSNPDENLKHTYRSLPNIPSLTHKIAKTLKRDYPDVSLAFRNIKTVANLFSKVKDSIPQDNLSNVIYSIPCQNCPSSYVGMTSNMLKTRIAAHRSNIKKLNLLREAGHTSEDIQIVELKQKTALLEHSITHHHNFDVNKVKILDQHNRTTALPILEMCHIINQQKTVNKRTDTDGLSCIYAGILQTLHNRNYKTDNTYTTDTTIRTIIANTQQPSSSVQLPDRI